MELERKEKEMIKSIFIQTTYKGVWGLTYDSDRSYRCQTFELTTDNEVLDKKIILKTQIPFTLKTNEKIYLNDIGETVTVRDVVKSLDGSYVYEVEPKYINNRKITKEEALKEFSIEQLNSINEEYKKLHENYIKLQCEFDKKKEYSVNKGSELKIKQIENLINEFESNIKFKTKSKMEELIHSIESCISWRY